MWTVYHSYQRHHGLRCPLFDGASVAWCRPGARRFRATRSNDLLSCDRHIFSRRWRDAMIDSKMRARSVAL
jgi:hypothetical protein